MSYYYSTEYTINGTSTLREAMNLKDRLKGIEGLQVVDKGDGKLMLAACEPDSLSSAPAGSHEFARGFLLFSTLLAVRHELTTDLWWEEHEVGGRTGRRVQVTHSGHHVDRRST